MLGHSLRLGLPEAKGGLGETGERPVYEEYRYDALGRCVLTRSRRLPGCDPVYLGIECASVIERVAWDGDQVLIEARTNGAEGLTWPGGAGSLDQETLDRQLIQTWFGNLITDEADGSGL